MTRKSAELRLIGLTTIPEIHTGDDLAQVIVDAAQREGTTIAGGDVLVLAQKIVSKAENRLVDLREVVPSPFALNLATAAQKDPRLVEVVLRETNRIVRMDHGVLIVETKHGFVCANAGVDTSNIPGDDVVSLLPADPDRSAGLIRDGLRQRIHEDVAVIISDTFGRPWREGLVDVALGVSGLGPLKDYRSTKDPYGHLLKVTLIAIADELASAAELVMGKTRQVPVVIIKGYTYERAEGTSRELVRSPERDLFR
jgi:coenzyme F420-0:L-glutamate ligase/coenzyme F420-1:gamma-L-glutamate ligase